MKPILGPAQRTLLERLARTPSLLAFDFDGTLAPIVTTPARAGLRPRTRRLLRQVARLYRCVVLTGRARADVAKRLRGIPLRAIVGNHGAEDGTRPRRPPPPAVRRWKRILQPRLASIPGIVIEDKRYSLTLHYRHAQRPRSAAREVRKEARRLRGARLVEGQFGLNVLPRSAPHKGTAFRRLLRLSSCETALFAGDDATDELVFARPRRGVVTVRVGARRGSRAAYFLRDQDEMDTLLATLVALRRGRGD